MKPGVLAAFSSPAGAPRFEASSLRERDGTFAKRLGASGLELAHLCSFAPNRHFSALPLAQRIASLHEDIGSDVETGSCYRALVVLNCRSSQMVQILSVSGLKVCSLNELVG